MATRNRGKSPSPPTPLPPPEKGEGSKATRQSRGLAGGISLLVAVKGRLTRLVLFLLLGAIVNVAVAWGGALLVDFHGAETVVGGAKGRRGDWVIWHHNAGGAIRIRALAVSGNNIEEYEQYPMHPWLLPLWSPLAVQVRQQVGDEPFVRVADAYGWPTYSLWCAFAWNTAQWPNVRTDPRLSAILITSPMGGNYALSQRALPLRPI